MTEVVAIEIWTDGSGPRPVAKGQRCIGAGGWAAVIKMPNAFAPAPMVCDLSGGAHDTTVSRMEMIAVCEALEWLTQVPRAIVIYCDSAMIVNCFADGWIEGWKRRGWINSKSKPVENRDLWERMEAAIARHSSVQFVKVKGHAGVEFNERADVLAREARDRLDTAA